MQKTLLILISFFLIKVDLEKLPHIKTDNLPYKRIPQTEKEKDLNVPGMEKKVYELISNDKKEC